MASDLYISGVGDAFDLSPKSIIWMRHRLGISQRRDLIDHATAARVSQAEKGDWAKFIKALE